MIFLVKFEIGSQAQKISPLQLSSSAQLAVVFVGEVHSLQCDSAQFKGHGGEDLEPPPLQTFFTFWGFLCCSRTHMINDYPSSFIIVKIRPSTVMAWVDCWARIWDKNCPPQNKEHKTTQKSEDLEERLRECTFETLFDSGSVPKNSPKK